MIEFLLGSAAIAVPQHQVPLFAGYLAVRFVKCLKRGRRRRIGQGNADQLANSKSTIDLEWTDLHLELTEKDGSVKKILNGISGKAMPGRLVAIMGPSGAGKTSLLNSLARQVPYSKNIKFSGYVKINGVDVDSDEGVSQGYVQQDDLFYSMLTVRETLKMAAHMRLPQSMTDSKKDEFVEDLIKRLGMAQSADTPVGDAKTRGLSGGEKKRLSIGCELVNSPSLMFVDEPTSGLDSFQAQKVVETLKNLASEGRTVVCSIHQPRSSVFAMFDDLVLLSGGEVVYSGPADKALAHFERAGFACPEHYNPAEFLADLISLDTSSPEAEQESAQVVDQLKQFWKDSDKKLYEVSTTDGAGSVSENGVDGDAKSSSQASSLRQFRLLFRRSWRQTIRDKATNVSRLMVNLNSALVFGSIYFRLTLTASTVQDRLGLLQVTAVNTAMASLTKMLNVFPPERTIVTRERARKSYGVIPYFAAKLLAEVPIGALFPLVFGSIVYPMCGLNPNPERYLKFLGILVVESFASAAMGLTIGGLAPNTNVALAIGPALMVIFIVFGGYYVNEESVAKPLRWIPNASLIQWGFQGLTINEFKGVEFKEEKGGRKRGSMRNGDDVLGWLGYDGVPAKKSIMANGRIIMFNYWLTYNILRAKKPKFAKLESPASN